MLKKVFSVVCTLCLLLLAACSNNTENVTSKNVNKYEYKAGDIVSEVISLQYDYAQVIYEDLASVEYNRKWGYINKNGKEVIPLKYENTIHYSEGFAPVIFNRKFGFVDKNGNEVISCKYDGATNFSEGLAAVKLNDKWGYIDKNGNEVTTFKYDDGSMFYDGLAAVKINDKWGYIDKKGNEIIPCDYDYAYSFQEGLAAVCLNGKEGYIDKKGNVVIPFEYDVNSVVVRNWFSEGLAKVSLNGKWGFIDKKGNIVIDAKYDEVSVYNYIGGLVAVKLNDKWGYIDKKGNEAISFIYEDATSFSEGLAKVKMNGKYGFIDKYGNEIVPLKYDETSIFSEGFAPVCLNGKWGYISYLPEYQEGYGDYYYKNGKKVTNKWVEGHYYGEDGKMYRSKKTPDGKWVGEDGAVVENINKDLEDSKLVEEVQPDSWYKMKSGLWYYFENDRTTTKKGWFNDTRDNQTYYFDPKTGIMSVGWTKIDGNYYYFNESHNNESNWYETENGFYESLGKKVVAYGSMLRNGQTPDGYYVDENGVRIDGSSVSATNNISKNILSDIDNMKCAKDYQAGVTFDKMDTLTFGTYKQSGDKEPIEWILLDKDSENNKALFISKYVLDCKPYNETLVSVNWDNCTLNKWLNNDFKNNVFTDEEKNNIINVIVPSVDDMNNYFNGIDSRKAIPTKFAKDNGCWLSQQYIIQGEKTVCYFLSDNGNANDKVSFVGDSGKIATWGSKVDVDDCGVRPAILVKYNSVKTASATTENNSSSSEGSSYTRQQLMKKLHDAIINKDDYAYIIQFGDTEYLELGLTDSAFTDAKFDGQGNLWLRDVGTTDGKGAGFEIIDKNNSNNNIRYYWRLIMNGGRDEGSEYTKNSKIISEEEYNQANDEFKNMIDQY